MTNQNTEAVSTSSVEISTSAKGAVSVKVKCYQTVDGGLDVPIEAVKMLERTNAELKAQGYTLAGS